VLSDSIPSSIPPAETQGQKPKPKVDCAQGPAPRGAPVAGVVEAEDVRPVVGHRLQLLPQEDVGLGLVGVDERYLGGGDFVGGRSVWV